jgi:hypothetical protein
MRDQLLEALATLTNDGFNLLFKVRQQLLISGVCFSILCQHNNVYIPGDLHLQLVHGSWLSLHPTARSYPNFRASTPCSISSQGFYVHVTSWTSNPSFPTTKIRMPNPRPLGVEPQDDLRTIHQIFQNFRSHLERRKGDLCKNEGNRNNPLTQDQKYNGIVKGLPPSPLPPFWAVSLDQLKRVLIVRTSA